MRDPAVIGFTRLPLRRLEPVQTIEGAACLRKATPGVTKNDAPSLNVELCNASDVVSDRIWREQVEAWKAFPIGAPLQIRGAIKAGLAKPTTRDRDRRVGRERNLPSAYGAAARALYAPSRNQVASRG